MLHVSPKYDISSYFELDNDNIGTEHRIWMSTVPISGIFQKIVQEFV